MKNFILFIQRLLKFTIIFFWNIPIVILGFIFGLSILLTKGQVYFLENKDKIYNKIQDDKNLDLICNIFRILFYFTLYNLWQKAK